MFFLFFYSLAGRTVAVEGIKFCLCHATSPDHLGLLLEFIKDTELWLTNIVSVAISQCLKSKITPPLPLLENLGQILQYQSLPPNDKKCRIISAVIFVRK